MVSIVRFSTFIVLFVALIVLSACNGARKSTKKHVSLNPIVVKSSDYEYRATPDRTWDILHTHVRLYFNWQERSANGEEWLEIQPYRPYYTLDSIILDAKSMKIELVKQINKKDEITLKYKQHNNKLVIYNISKDKQSLYIKYKATPYSSTTGGSKAIRDDRGLYFINHDNKIPNKPMQIWTQGETQSNSHWMPTFDVPNERFSTQVDLIVADTLTTLSNGKLTKQEKLPDGLRMDTWEMYKPIQPYVIMFVIGKYTVTKDFWRDREVSYYTENEYAPFARSIFSNTVEMLSFFSDITGVTYPWNKYSQVIVRDFVSGAMENTSASTFGEFVNQNDREIADKNYEDVVSHELFHQWFGDYVTAESWSNITLNESFANYGEQLWRKFKYGIASEQELAYNDLNTYLYSNSANKPLARYHYKSREDVFDRVSYQKGGAILRYLHGLIGDDAFSAAMKSYLTNNALQPAEIANWRMAVENATGKDWHWFFNQWYFRAGHPSLKIEHQYNDEENILKVTVTQNQNENIGLYTLPLKTLLISGESKEVVDWNITRREETFTYKYKNRVRPVVVPDIKHWLVGSIFEHKPSIAWKEQMIKVEQEDIISKLRAIYGNKLKKGKSPKEDYDEKSSIFELALIDNNAFIRQKVLTILGAGKSEKRIAYWKEKVKTIAENDKDNITRAIAINVLSNWKVNDSLLFFKSINSPSYAVSGAALNAIYVLNKDTAYTIAKTNVHSNPKAALRESIWAIIANNAKEQDFSLFDRYKYSFSGNSKISFTSTINDFVFNLNDIITVENSLAIEEELIINENIKPYRSSMVVALLELASDIKSSIAEARTNTQQNTDVKKFALVKNTIDKIIATEKDKENLTQYEMYYKKIFNTK